MTSFRRQCFEGFINMNICVRGEGLKGGHCSLILDGVCGAFFSSFSLLLEIEGSSELCCGFKDSCELECGCSFYRNSLQGKEIFYF